MKKLTTFNDTMDSPLLGHDATDESSSYDSKDEWE